MGGRALPGRGSKPATVVPKGFLSEQLDKENQVNNWLTQDYLENGHYSMCVCVHVVKDLDKKYRDKETVMRNSAERRIRGYLRLVCYHFFVFLLSHCRRAICPPVSPVNIWAMMIAWRIRRTIIGTVLCCIVYDSCAQWYAYTYEQFLKLTVCLGFL